MSRGTPQPAVAPLGRFDLLLFYVLAVVLCARPLLSESYERLEIGFLSVLPDSGAGPSPAVSAGLDAVLLWAAGLVLIRRRRWRGSTLVALGVALLAAAVIVSSMAASDPYLARLGGGGLVAGVLATIALATLLRTRALRNLVIAGLVATGVTTGAKCVRQVTSEFPYLQTAWEQEYRPALVAAGYDPTDPLIVNYERRIASRDAYGFLSHPNVTGTVLMVAALTAAGLAAAVAAGLRPTGRTGVVALLLAALGAGGLGAATWLTGSLGAVVSGALGLAFLVILARRAAWVRRHARVALLVLTLGYFGGMAAAAGYGVSRGTLPHASLAFRWHYWTAAARAYADVPLTGLGRLNFVQAYTRYKSPVGTEEVRDPHNLWVSLLVELGPLGLAAGLALAGAALVAALRRLGLPPLGSAQPASWSAVVLPAAPLVFGVLVLQVWLAGTDVDAAALALVWLADVALTWCAAFVLTLAVLGVSAASDRGAAWVDAGLCAAVLAAFVHALLDFALFTPGGLAFFGLCAAAAAGGRISQRASEPEGPAGGLDPQSPAEAESAFHVAAVLLAGAVVVLQPFFVCLPAAIVHRKLKELDGRSMLRTTFGDRAAFRMAVRAWLQNVLEHESSKQGRVAALDVMRQNTSREANAWRDTGTFTLLAQLEAQLAAAHTVLGNAGEAAAARRRAAEAWDQAVAAYPTNPRTRIAAGDAWAAVWRDERPSPTRPATTPAGSQPTGVPDAAERARAHLKEALRIDVLRPSEEVNRLRPVEREHIEALLAELH